MTRRAGPATPARLVAAVPVAALWAALWAVLLAASGCGSAPGALATAPVAAVSAPPPAVLASVDIEGEAAPAALACPPKLPAHTQCRGGRDRFGAYYLIAMPSPWSGVLVLHVHGGPELGPPNAERTVQDLQRWSVMLRAGHALAVSSFRQGGVAVHAAAEDSERLRRLFVAHVAKPRRTVLHGQSWGAGVAAVGAELFGAAEQGRSPYDAVLLSSGVLGGGTRSYDFRLDLRVVYQQLCGNHPRPDEPAYPLWLGLPADARLSRADLAARSKECLGLGLPAAQRSVAQQQRLTTLLAVVGVPERSLLGHLNWATWHFQDIALHRTGSAEPRSVFGNRGVRYAGSPDDDALNRAVLRYAADAQAVAAFAADTDPGGRIDVPVLSVHAVDDPVAFVELESTFRETMARAGRAQHLVQTFAAFDEHSYLSDVSYATLMSALLTWVDTGRAPTPLAIARGCAAQVAAFGEGCHFLPDYEPQALDQRVPPRLRP